MKKLNLMARGYRTVPRNAVNRKVFRSRSADLPCTAMSEFDSLFEAKRFINIEQRYYLMHMARLWWCDEHQRWHANVSIDSQFGTFERQAKRFP